MSSNGMFYAERSGFGGERKASVGDYLAAQVLPDLYCELVDILGRVQKLPAGCETNLQATNVLLDRVVEVERLISDIPARSLEDALAKIRFLRLEIGAEMAGRHVRMLDETIAVLKRLTEH